MSILLSNPMRVGCVIALLNLAGCASIVTGTSQSMAVETRTANGQEVHGANCRLVNSKGTWFVTTPGSVTIHRASVSPLSINCTKDGQQQLGVSSTKPKSKGMTWGNLLFGGVVGVITDGVTGAAGYYPSPITVIMEIIGNAVAQPAVDAGTPGADALPETNRPVEASPSPTRPATTPTSQPATDWRSWGSQGN